MPTVQPHFQPLAPSQPNHVGSLLELSLTSEYSRKLMFNGEIYSFNENLYRNINSLERCDHFVGEIRALSKRVLAASGKGVDPTKKYHPIDPLLSGRFEKFSKDYQTKRSTYNRNLNSQNSEEKEALNDQERELVKLTKEAQADFLKSISEIYLSSNPFLKSCPFENRTNNFNHSVTGPFRGSRKEAMAYLQERVELEKQEKKDKVAAVFQAAQAELKTVAPLARTGGASSGVLPGRPVPGTAVRQTRRVGHPLLSSGVQKVVTSLSELSVKAPPSSPASPRKSALGSLS